MVLLVHLHVQLITHCNRPETITTEGYAKVLTKPVSGFGNENIKRNVHTGG